MSDTLSLIESSFEKIKPDAIAFSHCFYEHLFRNSPALEAMFSEVSQELQEKKLVASLALIVENLHNPTALAQALQGLGAYHVTKGTEQSHYPLVGQALLQAFEDFLQEDWTPELAQAWVSAYELITDIMLEGTHDPEAHLKGELTFYEWLDLYGDMSPTFRSLVQETTHFKYGVH
ncbi:MAG: globin family protein [Cyanobacteria bacterium P01_A01_bin.135]